MARIDTSLGVIIAAFFIFNIHCGPKSNNSDGNKLLIVQSDECENALEIKVSPIGDWRKHSKYFHLGYATDSPGSPSCDSLGVNNDVWYYFKAPKSGDIAISILDCPDCIEMALYKSCDQDELTCQLIVNQYIYRGLNPDSVYILNVWQDSYYKKFPIEISITEADVPPINDLCQNALDITEGKAIETDATYSSDISKPSTPCGGSVGRGIWYKFIGDGNRYTITAKPIDWDLELGVYTGECNKSLRCIVNSEKRITGQAESVSILAKRDTTYYIYLSYWSSRNGTMGKVAKNIEYKSNTFHIHFKKE